MVVGGDDKKYIAALIVPSFIQLENWAKINSISYNSVSELIQHNKTWELIQQEIDRININFGKWEQIKKFELIPHEWSVETGELTPTMKLKRKIIENKYSDIVNRIYNI
jgi:long-chain acyl-CoA synthetase